MRNETCQQQDPLKLQRYQLVIRLMTLKKKQKHRSQMYSYTSALADKDHESHRWNGWISSSTWSLYL